MQIDLTFQLDYHRYTRNNVCELEHGCMQFQDIFCWIHILLGIQSDLVRPLFFRHRIHNTGHQLPSAKGYLFDFKSVY